MGACASQSTSEPGGAAYKQDADDDAGGGGVVVATNRATQAEPEEDEKAAATEVRMNAHAEMATTTRAGATTLAERAIMPTVASITAARITRCSR
jgi:hypothetical protein